MFRAPLQSLFSLWNKHCSTKCPLRTRDKYFVIKRGMPSNAKDRMDEEWEGPNLRTNESKFNSLPSALVTTIVLAIRRHGCDPLAMVHAIDVSNEIVWCWSKQSEKKDEESSEFVSAVCWRSVSWFQASHYWLTIHTCLKPLRFETFDVSVC